MYTINRPHILIVDDDEIGRRLVCKALEGLDYTLEIASNGRQAIERVTRRAPDLLILDVMMPKIDGLEVCRVVKSAPETFIPVILLTAKGDMDSKVQALQLGAEDYLVKPFNSRELQARVESMLRIKAMQNNAVLRKQELESLSITDELTGLLNHRAMQQRLRTEFSRSQRYSDPLSVLMIDVDYFKSINDTYGHQTGDKALQKMARVLKKCVRDVGLIRSSGTFAKRLAPSLPAHSRSD